jgi:hypothetical protein
MLSARYAFVVLSTERAAFRQALARLMRWESKAAAGGMADLPQLVGLLAFIEAFTARLQPKERALLQRLRGRARASGSIAAQIEAEQDACTLFLSTAQLLARQPQDGSEDGIGMVCTAVRHYCSMADAHLAKAEDLMPLAWQALSVEDWFGLAVSFSCDQQDSPASTVPRPSREWPGSGRPQPAPLLQGGHTSPSR